MCEVNVIDGFLESETVLIAAENIESQKIQCQ